MQRKRSTEEEESVTAVQREMKEKKLRNDRQALFWCLFFSNCVHLLYSSCRVLLNCRVVKSRRGWGGGAITSLPLSPLVLCILSSSLCLHRFFGGWAVRGGVTGRPEDIPPYWYFAFFSEGFKIYKHTHTV